MSYGGGIIEDCLYQKLEIQVHSTSILCDPTTGQALC